MGAERAGGSIPEEVQSELRFRKGRSEIWEYVAPPSTNAVAEPVEDARFPGASVRCGTRELPLVVVLGAPCRTCDKSGTTVCHKCGGAGTVSGAVCESHEYDCEPREVCQRCAGTKFHVSEPKAGKGLCRHPKGSTIESSGSTWVLQRCADCGLASISWGEHVTDVFACGVCGFFDCRCPRKR